MKKELIAELFEKAQEFTTELTSHNVVQKKLKGKSDISKEHTANNTAVRKMLKERSVHRNNFLRLKM
jgi:DNA-damage-inducible protein D